MVLKQRYRWGYRTLVVEVSDSIHLRRFCRISRSERVPDESSAARYPGGCLLLALYGRDFLLPLTGTSTERREALV
jgi:hypothetical protein